MDDTISHLLVLGTPRNMRTIILVSFLAALSVAAAAPDGCCGGSHGGGGHGGGGYGRGALAEEEAEAQEGYGSSGGGSRGGHGRSSGASVVRAQLVGVGSLPTGGGSGHGSNAISTGGGYGGGSGW
ncbi:ctenidin-1-like [Penaeus chinensis]|uniref:ctenidin-1-like n=1 Tax=Penaeus chinensis TaxID=139456 RepID=UPI001FB6E49D|nr:ctenidin-1-like [Penaeus chinensis]